MNLYKADTCLKRTKYLEPQVSALDRFYCIHFIFFDVAKQSVKRCYIGSQFMGHATHEDTLRDFKVSVDGLNVN